MLCTLLLVVHRRIIAGVCRRSDGRRARHRLQRLGLCVCLSLSLSLSQSVCMIDSMTEYRLTQPMTEMSVYWY